MDFFLIDVDTIKCSVPYSQIKDNEKKIDRLANLILDSEGIINPIFVKKIGSNSYELVYGEIEYYAMTKVANIDPEKGETIAAFIIEDAQKELMKQQIDFLRKSLSNGDDPPKVVCTASHNLNKLNSVQKDINQIHEKLASLMEMNTAKGLKDLLKKQLESIISEAEIKSKEEAIQYLTKAKYDLQEQQNKIKDQILELSKVNLVDITYEQLSTLMQQAAGKSNQIKASWKAIEYWRKSDQGLTWDNLKKSIGGKKSEHKIDNFGQKTYDKLREVAYL
ncbi:MAG: chromosome partitioning protein ParB [Crocosphaera sp.]|nr:chromosome partitioning protein ParB [Crocosphaera sp.]